MTLLLVPVIWMLLAAIMSLVAWYSSREERRRADARIAVLAAEIHAEPTEWPASAGSAGDLFAARPPARKGFHFAAMAAGGLFVCACAAALAVVTSTAPGQASKHAPAGVERYTDSEHRAIAGP